MVTKQNTKPITRQHVRVEMLTDAQITPQAFNDLYEKNLQKFSHWTFEQVYEETERLVSEKYGARKYSSADSFRQIRKRIIHGKPKV